MEEELSTSTRDAPPSHFIFKIEAFSTLASSSLEKYESCVFNASGYKWKLVVYPNGNKSKGGEDHISLYLVQADGESELASVTFRLFVFDYNRHKYLYAEQVIQNQGINSEMGFHKFLPLKTFINPSNGYLINDTCMFGAEVSPLKNEAKGQCLSMMPRKPAPFMHTWKVEGFSKLGFEAQYSKIFTTGGHDWKMMMYPKGYGSGAGKSIYLFLCLADSVTLLPAGRDAVVQMKLRIVDRLRGNPKEKDYIISLNSFKIDWESCSFIDLKDLNKSTGYLLNDTCILEAEVTVLGSAQMWIC